MDGKTIFNGNIRIETYNNESPVIQKTSVVSLRVPVEQKQEMIHKSGNASDYLKNAKEFYESFLPHTEKMILWKDAIIGMLGSLPEFPVIGKRR